MYSTATSSRYGLPRTTSYSSSSSRYSSISSSSLPPVSTRYTPSRYSTYSTSTVSLPRHSTISSRYYSTAPLYTKPPLSLDTSWKPSSSTSSVTASSPSLTRKSNVSLLTRRPSYSSFNSDLGYYSRSGSVSSLSSSSDNYTGRSGSTPCRSSQDSSTAVGSDVWLPRSSRLNSTSSTTTESELPSSSYSSTQSTSSSKLAGRVGLHNLGNTCFMNAVLQCLCHTKPLLDYCLRGSFSRELNTKSPTNGKLIKAFSSVVNLMWLDSAQDVSPGNLKRELERYAPRFLGYNQQDAQELLRYLLQGLHEDINRATPIRGSWNSNISEGLTESRHASASWRQYKNTDDSKIVDLFCGQLKSTLTCSDCGNVSITFDPFWDLSLPIPEGSGVTLQKCLQLFSSVEVLDGPEMPVCDKCKKKTRCKKQLVIVKCPQILVIHLKRFSTYKLNVFVDSPRSLDITQFVSSYSPGMSTVYNLYGIVDHFGSISGGHYTAKCKNPYEEEWNEFNDSRVKPVSLGNLVTSSAYLLFYEQGWNTIGSRL